MILLVWLAACGPDDDDCCQGGGGGGGGATTDTSDTAASTGPVTAFTLRQDAEVPMVLHALWPESGAAEERVEYRVAGGDWLVAPEVSPGDAPIFGVPELTEVEARLVWTEGGAAVTGDPLLGTTGAVPLDVPIPEVTVHEPSLEYDAPYAMITVASGDFTFEGPYYLEIFDREGRLVWFHEVEDGLFSFYAHVALDGTHLWHDQTNIFGFSSGDSGVTRRTLDGRQSVFLPVDDMGQAISEGPDGAFFVERRSSKKTVDRLDPDGTLVTEWDCGAWAGTVGVRAGECGMNAVTWDEGRDTILASFFELSTVVEIDRATGAPIRQMGQLTEGDPYTFDPPESMFAYQHAPYWTPEGTLLVSTHAACDEAAPPDECEENFGQWGVQIAAEYTVDDATKTLTRIWSHTSTDLWATQVGEAYRLPNGNLVQGYGQDGAVREITPDGTTAWQVAWDKDWSGYRVVGHVSFLTDLYALNQGW